MSPSRPPYPSRLPRVLHGAPLRLPRALDATAEWWWRATPRTRALFGALAVVAVLAAGIGHAAASPYGPPTPVLIATRDLLPGEAPGPGDLERVSVPSALVPTAATTEPGGVISHALPTGAILTSRHLGDGGWAASLPAGRVAVPVRAAELPPLTPGTHLDVIGAGADGQGRRLSAEVVVLSAVDDQVWLSIGAEDAVAVSAAASAGALAVVVLPP